MKTFILGGDGFCGWPTSLHLSNLGHEVWIIDNLSRRNIDNELGVESLTPIRTIFERIEAWEEISGNVIQFVNMDIAQEYDRFLALLIQEQPDNIVHFAEQRAAPYSMKSSRHKRYTVNNNINATNNVLCAILDSELDIHLVHLGTMGVYGYGTAGAKIPEGYLDIFCKDANGQLQGSKILYPANPGSVYHTTKTLDQLLFYYYNKNDHIRITDLHQGIVWGTNTVETRLDERLINRFDYDSDYGTVLNRFLMEAAVGYPLTVYGTGGQTRAFINIQDTVKCIQLAIENPPDREEKVKIYNQATETHRVIDLANKICKLTGAEINFIENPRNEANENELLVENENFLKLGLDPIKLSDGLMREVTNIAGRFVNRCNKKYIAPRSYWKKKSNVEA